MRESIHRLEAGLNIYISENLPQALQVMQSPGVVLEHSPSCHPNLEAHHSQTIPYRWLP